MVNVIPKEMYKEGLSYIQQNAMHLKKACEYFFDRKNYLCAYLLGFASCEEYGKALFLIENWDTEYISMDIWREKFLNHYEKIAKSVLSGDRVKFERLAHGSIFAKLIIEGVVDLLLDEEFVSKIHDMRTACLYVDYDFTNNCWEPALDNFDKMSKYAFQVFGIAIEAHNALEKKWKELWDAKKL